MTNNRKLHKKIQSRSVIYIFQKLNWPIGRREVSAPKVNRCMNVCFRCVKWPIQKRASVCERKYSRLKSTLSSLLFEVSCMLVRSHFHRKLLVFWRRNCTYIWRSKYLVRKLYDPCDGFLRFKCCWIRGTEEMMCQCNRNCGWVYFCAILWLLPYVVNCFLWQTRSRSNA